MVSECAVMKDYRHSKRFWFMTSFNVSLKRRLYAFTVYVPVWGKHVSHTQKCNWRVSVGKFYTDIEILSQRGFTKKKKNWVISWERSSWTTSRTKRVRNGTKAPFSSHSYSNVHPHFCLDLNVFPRTRPRLTLVFLGPNCSLLLENQTLESDYMAGPHTRLLQGPAAWCSRLPWPVNSWGKTEMDFLTAKKYNRKAGRRLNSSCWQFMKEAWSFLLYTFQ